MSKHETAQLRWVTIVLSVFKYFYLVSAILLLVAFLFETLAGQFRIDILIPIIVTSVLTFGIHKRRSWVIIVITILAAWGIISNIIAPYTLPAALIATAILGFEIYFFNRKDVRACFGAKPLSKLF